jgi:hypothetical protein
VIAHPASSGFPYPVDVAEPRPTQSAIKALWNLLNVCASVEYRSIAGVMSAASDAVLVSAKLPSARQAVAKHDH